MTEYPQAIVIVIAIAIVILIILDRLLDPMLTRPEEFENERFRSEMFSVHTTPFGEVSVGEIT